MTVLSSVNLLLIRVTFLCAIAFFCFKNVTSILDNSYILVLTQAMDLPQLIMSQYSAQLGLFGFLFILLALTDLVPLLEDNKTYFYSIVPIRLFAYFITASLSFVWNSNLYLHNNAVFIYSFIEIWINFLIYNALREEKETDLRTIERERYISQDTIDEPDSFVATSIEIERVITTESTIEQNEEEENDDKNKLETNANKQKTQGNKSKKN